MKDPIERIIIIEDKVKANLKRNTCPQLDLSTSSYYRWKNQDNIPPKENDVLKNLQSIAAEFPKYGYRRITKALQREGIVINHKKVRRIMKENNLLARRKKLTWCPKTGVHSKH